METYLSELLKSNLCDRLRKSLPGSFVLLLSVFKKNVSMLRV